MSASMTRTQIQLPDDLYRRAKALAADREISLAELVRNGLEYMLSALTPPNAEGQGLEMPVLSLGSEKPDFEYPEFGEEPQDEIALALQHLVFATVAAIGVLVVEVT